MKKQYSVFNNLIYKIVIDFNNENIDYWNDVFTYNYDELISTKYKEIIISGYNNKYKRYMSKIINLNYDILIIEIGLNDKVDYDYIKNIINNKNNIYVIISDFKHNYNNKYSCLYVDRCNINNEILINMCNILKITNNIKILDLSHNSINDIEPLKVLINLVKIILRKTQIKNINSLNSLSKLHFIDLFNTFVNIDDIRNFYANYTYNKYLMFIYSSYNLVSRKKYKGVVKYNVQYRLGKL